MTMSSHPSQITLQGEYRFSGISHTKLKYANQERPGPSRVVSEYKNIYIALTNQKYGSRSKPGIFFAASQFLMRKSRNGRLH